MSAPRMSAPVSGGDTVSAREFARLDGCDEKLVRRAIKAGKLPITGENRLDPALAGTGWRKRNRNRPAGADKRADKAENVRTVSAPPVRKAPSAEDVEQATDELFAEEAEDYLNKVLAGEFADIATAERIKENGLAAKHLLAARRAAGQLVEMELAQQVLFETQRGQRDAWINFPTRIGPLLAAELGVESDKVVEALTVHVHQQLSDLGEPEADFGPGDQAA